MDKRTYSEKLRDPKWQKKRLEILSRDEFSCQLCYDTSTTLHVHHRLYIKGNEPWEYDEKLLVTLCETCHEQEGLAMKEDSATLIDAFKLAGFFSGDLQNMACDIRNMKLQHASEVVASAYAYAFKSEEMQALILELFFKSLNEKRNKSEGKKNG